MTGYEQTLQEIMSMLRGFVPEGTDLQESTEFVADLDFDSVQVMEFLPELEDGFDIMIPLNKVEDVSNIGELAQLVLQLREGD